MSFRNQCVRKYYTSFRFRSIFYAAECKCIFYQAEMRKLQQSVHAVRSIVSEISHHPGSILWSGFLVQQNEVKTKGFRVKTFDTFEDLLFVSYDSQYLISGDTITHRLVRKCTAKRRLNHLQTCHAPLHRRP